MQILSAEYEKILAQSSELLTEAKDLVANAANLTALLFEALEAVDWVGIYFLRNGELVLGPFQGRAVKPRVSLGRSAAGRVVRDLRSVITEGRTLEEAGDDDLSQAQVIVPILLHERCVGVLEIDSPFAGRFNDHDRAGLEAIATLLIRASDTTPLLPRRATLSDLRTEVTVPVAAGPSMREQVAPEPEKAPAAPAAQQVMPTMREDLPPPPPHRATARGGQILVFFAALMPWATLVSRDSLIHGCLVVITFGLFGTALGAARRLRVRRVAAVSFVYALIFVCVESFIMTQKGIPGHLGDLMSGLLGGYVGGAIGRGLRRRSPPHQKAAAWRRP